MALLHAGLEAAETSYPALGWKAPRRLVVIREELRARPDARGRRLIEVPGSTFQVLVTTLAHDPVQTWPFYKRRVASENRLKELKQDFGADGLVCSLSMVPKPPSACSAFASTSSLPSSATLPATNLRA
jgi:hypothetical protein